MSVKQLDSELSAINGNKNNKSLGQMIGGFQKRLKAIGL
jgi:hypothetical protein